MTAVEVRLNAGDFLPGDVEKGPVRAISSQAGLSTLKHSPTRFGAPIPSAGVVTQPNPAPADVATPSLVQLDRDEAAARTLNAAMNWEATETAAPWEHAEAEAALRDAARDYRAVAE